MERVWRLFSFGRKNRIFFAFTSNHLIISIYSPEIRSSNKYITIGRLFNSHFLPKILQRGRRERKKKKLIRRTDIRAKLRPKERKKEYKPSVYLFRLSPGVVRARHKAVAFTRMSVPLIKKNGKVD